MRTWMAIIPLALIVLLSILSSPSREDPTRDLTPRKTGRLVIVIIDSLRAEVVDDHMPALRRLASQGLRRDITTCTANFTLPCIQTLLEGRQSPFVAGLHNFTGKRGSAQSLPALFANAGLKQAMISDYTIHSLYGYLTPDSQDVEKKLSGYLARDEYGLREASARLDDPDMDVVYVHIVGTDKVAHHKLPGHPQYIAHFEAVDVALEELTSKLSPERDHIIITGDHGHNASGHHTRQSIAIMQGPIWKEVLAAQDPGLPIEQPDLTALLAGVFALPLPADAESQLPGIDAIPTSTKVAEHWRLFLERQSEVLHKEGLGGDDLSAQLRARDARLRGESAATAAKYAALLPLFLIWMLCFLTQPSENRWRTRILLGLPVMAVALVLLTWVLPASVMVMLTLLLSLGVAAHVVRRRSDRQDTGLLRVWAAAALLAMGPALMGTGWSELFHSTGSFGWHIPLFFGGLIFAGALLSWIWSKRVFEQLPHGMALAALMLLPSGVYYYQFGQNILQGLAIGGAIWMLAQCIDPLTRQTLWTAIKPDTPVKIVAQLTVVGCLFLLLRQHAGGWAWGLHFRDTLSRSPLLSAAAALGLLGVINVLLPSWRARGILSAHALVFGIISTGVGRLPLHAAASALLPFALLAGIFRLLPAERSREPLPKRLELEAVLTFACVLASAWVMLEGFFIGNVEFQFALDLFSKLPSDVVAALSGLAIFGKYGAPLLLGTLIYALCSPAHWKRGMHLLVSLGLLKLLCLAGFILFAPLFSTDKLHEVAFSDFLFVYHITAMLWLTVVASQVMEWGRAKSSSAST